MEVLFILFIFLGIITVVGHLIWLGIAAVYRWAFEDEKARHVPVVPRNDPVLAKLVNLKTTEQQIIQFYEEGKLDDQTYEHVISQIRAERALLVNPTPKPERAPAPPPAPVVSVVANDEVVVIKPVPSFKSTDDAPPRRQPSSEPPPAPPRPPRRSFSEAPNSFN